MGKPRLRPMIGWGVCLLGFIAGCAGATPATRAPASTSKAALETPPFVGFTRGMNLGNALDAPNEGEWGVVLSEAHFEHIAAAGFDHVRLPVRFNAHADLAAPYAIDQAFFERVDWALDQAMSRKLNVLLDFHHYNELMSEPEQHRARFLGIWEQIAQRYADRSEQLAFELLNEPHQELSPKLWNEILNQAIPLVRQTNADRFIVVDSYNYASADHLLGLSLPEDDLRIVATFHMYQPILFTHQGAHWMTPEYQTTGLVFPGPPPTPIEPVAAAKEVDWVSQWFKFYNTLPAEENPAGPVAVSREFKKVDAFRNRTGRQVYMGEFGAIDKADASSRERYIRLVRSEAEKRQIGWAYWDDGGSYQILDVAAGTWNAGLKRALLD